MILLPRRDSLEAQIFGMPCKGGKVQLAGGGAPPFLPQRTSSVLVQRHPRHRACADGRGSNCRRALKRYAMG